jgi:hypothetical protein
LTDISEYLTVAIIKAMNKLNVESITLMMETVRSSETSVSIYQTARCYIPEDSHLQDLNQ